MGPWDLADSMSEMQRTGQPASLRVLAPDVTRFVLAPYLGNHPRAAMVAG